MMRKPGSVLAALLLAAGVVAAQGESGPERVPRLPALPPPGAEARIPDAETGAEGGLDAELSGWDYRPPEGGLAKLPLDNSSPRPSGGPPGAASQTLTTLVILGAVLSALFLWYARALRRQQER